MAHDVWDDAGEDGAEVKRLRPLFTINPSNDKELKEWVLRAKDYALGKSRERVKDIKRHIELYSGTHHQSVGAVEDRARSNSSVFSKGATSRSPSTSKVTVNHLYSLTENLVARVTRYKPSVSVLPANSEDVSDREASKLIEELISHLQYVNDFDEITRQYSRRKYVAGEAYVFIEWDPCKGDYHPEVKKKMENDEELELDGEKLKPEEMRIGDISYRVPQTYNIFLQPQPDGDFDKVDWLIEKKYVDVDELRKEYPKKAKDIKDTNPLSLEDDEDVDLNIGREMYGNLDNEIPVYELWHRRTKYVPKGRHVVFTEDTILLNEDNPYDHGKLPCIRITDIDVDGRLYGESIFYHTKQLNNLINNLYSITYRNQVLVGHPKWVVHKDAKVNMQDLSNDITVVKYDGQVRPKLEVYNNTPAETMNLMQDLTERMQQIMKVFGVSRGEPPPGIKAGIALQFLNEQENELFNNDVNKHNKVIKELWKLSLEVVRQYYDDSDERIIRIFGEGKEYLTRTFNPTVLNTNYDIRVQNSSALPDSKPARTQYLLDLDERKPIPDDKFYEYLDMGIPDAYITEETRAKRSASIENKMFMDGKDVKEPAPFEDQWAHWQEHTIFVQSRQFKEADEDDKLRLQLHILATEHLIMEKAFFNNDITKVKNPAMAEIVSANPNFPLLYGVVDPAKLQPPPPPPAPPPPVEPLIPSPGAPIPPGAPLPSQPLDPLATPDPIEAGSDIIIPDAMPPV